MKKTSSQAADKTDGSLNIWVQIHQWFSHEVEQQSQHIIRKTQSQATQPQWDNNRSEKHPELIMRWELLYVPAPRLHKHATFAETSFD